MDEKDRLAFLRKIAIAAFDETNEAVIPEEPKLKEESFGDLLKVKNPEKPEDPEE